MSRATNKALVNILGFMSALTMEIQAFEETRTKHDRMRADKALSYLEDQITELRKELNNVQLRSDE